MLIIADENIPFAREAFSQFGDVRLLPGRKLTREDLAGAGALIVRSVTKVNAALLEDTAIRFVGTATIGTDHLDIPWLERAGIRWASAAGCNARSVVEWVLAALVEYCLPFRLDWQGLTLGIVGHGNIGSRLAVVARDLGMRVLVNDPPLARAGRLAATVDLPTLLAESDFVTCHVPYTRTGPDPTHHLIGWGELDLMKPGAALLNSSRGPVLDNEAARSFAKGDILTFLLDVFENEPTPNRELLAFSLIATPHIAGYSFEGKVNGTRIMAETMAEFLATASTWRPQLPPPPDNKTTIAGAHPMLAFQDAIRRSYNIHTDDAALRGGLTDDDAAWGAHFDALRRDYPQRREFANYHLRYTGASERIARSLAAMGFALI